MANRNKNRKKQFQLECLKQVRQGRINDYTGKFRNAADVAREFNMGDMGRSMMAGYKIR